MYIKKAPKFYKQMENKPLRPLENDYKGFKDFTLSNGLQSNVKYVDIKYFKAMRDQQIFKLLAIGIFSFCNFFDLFF